MKKYLFLCFCTALVLPTATAQSVRFHQNLQTYVSVDSSMGYYLPAFDTVWSLVVFVNYPKAALHSDSWPHGTKQLPSFAKKTVAPDLTSMDPDSSLTGYLHEASLGRLTFIGQTYPEVIQPEHDMEYYNNNGQLGAMVYEALDRVNKSGLINWEALDHWSKVNGKWRKQPDGVIENIIVIFRDDPTHFGYNWTGSGGGIAALLCKDYYINDHLVIKGGSMGSGLISNSGAEFFPRHFRLLKHELAHYFTLDHYSGLNGFYGPDYTNHGAWGLAAAHGSSSICVNSWDRQKLGWSRFLVDADARSAGDTTVVLHDFITTGEAARIKLPYVNDEYFLLEYHNNTARFDAVDGTVDALYILHQSGQPENHLDMEEADGRWDFVVSDSVESWEPCCGKQPMVKRLDENPFVGFGDHDDLRMLRYTHRDDTLITQDNMQRALAFAIEGEEHIIRCNGDGKDGFTTEKGRNEFSMATNPSTASNGVRLRSLTTVINGISIQVLQMEKDCVTVQIRYHHFHIDRNVRWTGSILLHDHLTINRGRELLLNQSVNFNRMYKPRPATLLMVKGTGSITVEKNARLVLDEQSTLVLEGNAKIYLKEGAKLVVKNGSRIIADNSRIIKAKGAVVVYK